MTFEEFCNERFYLKPYEYLTRVPGESDISASLPVLEYYAGKVNSVVEFGTRDCHSTCALLSGLGKSGGGTLTSYDLIPTAAVRQLQKIELPKGVTWEFYQADTTKLDVIPYNGLLFIDTLHNYNQVVRELEVGFPYCQRYVAFHDWSTCRYYDASGDMQEGIGRAVEELMAKFECLQIVYETDRNNGLLILESVHS